MAFFCGLNQLNQKKEGGGEKMMKKVFFLAVMIVVVGCFGSTAFAHFGMIIPSDTMVMQGDKRVVKVVASFSHPFEGNGMELAKPVQFGVMTRGKKQGLLSQLKEIKVFGHKAWELDYRVKRPGVYAFYLEPKPYWEPAEDKYIVHYTKTIISAFGDEEGWDEPVGLKTEIVSLTRPFGLYAGNVFQGVVLLDGKPAPYSEVEVEYYNKDGRAKAPTDYMVTQVIGGRNKCTRKRSGRQAGKLPVALLLGVQPGTNKGSVELKKCVAPSLYEVKEVQ
ncbi:MAG: ATP-dependent DNA ligase [Desulfobacteraceae bacterium 4484_190.3]|nr:MAG: ATP-dependent DNA ligase [Desulfobacteraceae bacterium 4484_190.3]